MNPFASRFSSQSPILAMSVMALVSGLMISLAWITNDIRRDPDIATRVGTGSIDLQEDYKKIMDEVAKLREENGKLQNAMSKESGQAKLLNDSLQDVKLFAGLSEVVGPGVTVTLRDGKQTMDIPINDKIIHDTDVLKVVNELWNAGAEAIAVNGNRVVLGTSFRCVGNVILVDKVKIASPVVIQAIGDGKTIKGAMEMPGGVYDELRGTDPTMIEVALVQSMRLPAYGGSTERKFASVPKEPK